MAYGNSYDPETLEFRSQESSVVLISAFGLLAAPWPDCWALSLGISPEMSGECFRVAENEAEKNQPLANLLTPPISMLLNVWSRCRSLMYIGTSNPCPTRSGEYS